MRILVTGGAGFIGSHIVDRLVARGDEVTIIDDLSHGKSENLNPKAKFIQLGITDPKLEQAFADARPEAVIHQAAQADVGRSIKDPVQDAETNILGSLRLLECCRKHGAKRFVYANSCGAYGDPEDESQLPLSEEQPIAPISPYGISKQAVENYLQAYARLFGITFVSLRYANVYGPRQDPHGEGGVVAIFANALMGNRQPTIYGDGNQTRDFVYVEDIAEANVLALTKGSNCCLNAGTGKETSINRVFDLMRKACGSTTEALRAPARAGDIRRSVLNAEKARKILGWTAKTSIEEGLARTIAFFRAQK